MIEIQLIMSAVLHKKITPFFMLILILAALPSGLAAAQSNCGNGLPCGPIPWKLPRWPTMESPTPIGTQYDYGTVTYTPTPTPTDTPTATPTNTATPTPTETWTPAPTPTAFLTDVPMADTVATAQAAAQVDAVTVYSVDGTPMAKEAASSLVDPMIFAYIKGISADIFGPFEPLAVVLFVGFGLQMFMMVAKLFLFVGSILLGFVRKVVEFIMNLIPL